jgi:hypothetical protein
MRFITPEIVKANLSEYLSELYKTTDIKKEAEQDTAGNNLPRVSEIMQENTKPAYTYGSTQLYYLYESINYDDTSGRTIADLSSDINGSITNYTSLSTEGFTWQFQNWINTNKPFKTSFWWTIITDQGIIFTKPERQASSNQIATFKVVSHNDRTDNLDNVSYQGETGADIYISANVDMVVPDTLDSTLKTMTINKFKSANDVVIIRSQYDANPLDYIVYNNNTYLVINKKQLTAPAALKALYEYICIREVTDTYTITGSDETPPVHPLIGTTAGGGGTFLDLTDTPASYSGKSGNIVSVSTSENGLEFTAPSGGLNLTLIGSEKTVLNTSRSASGANTFVLSANNYANETDDTAITLNHIVNLSISVSGGGSGAWNMYIAQGATGITTNGGLLKMLVVNPGESASAKITLILPHGLHQLYFQKIGSPANLSILVKAKETQWNDIDYSSIT